MVSSTIWKSMLQKNKDLLAKLVKNANVTHFYCTETFLMIYFLPKKKICCHRHKKQTVAQRGSFTPVSSIRTWPFKAGGHVAATEKNIWHLLERRTQYRL